MVVALFSLLGVLVGSIVTVFTTVGVELLRDYLHTRRLRQSDRRADLHALQDAVVSVVELSSKVARDRQSEPDAWAAKIALAAASAKARSISVRVEDAEIRNQTRAYLMVVRQVMDCIDSECVSVGIDADRALVNLQERIGVIIRGEAKGKR